ncbi:MAG: hypothetical protein AB1401_03235 [Thermodesulfobacteriota bacterium]
MNSEITIKCVCGRDVTLELIAGQYQDEYQGDCKCSRQWFLKELTAALAEIDAC